MITLPLFTCCALATMDLPDPAILSMTRMTATTPVEHDRYGSNIALSENFAAATLWGGDSRPGSVYLYRKMPDFSWQLYTNIIVPRSVVNRFGLAGIAMDDKTLAVGGGNAGSHPLGSGAVMIFSKNSTGNWVSNQIITAQTPTAGHYFGDAIALYDDTLVIGAYGYGGENGQVWVYTNSTDGVWHYSTEIGSTISNDQFGKAVAVNDKWLAIGGPNATVSGQAEAGHVRIYQKSSGGSWVHPKDIYGYIRSHARLGTSLALNGDTIAVGSPGISANGTVGGGDVLIYDLTAEPDPVLLQRLLSPKIGVNAHFGTSLSTDGNLLAVGAPNYTVSDYGQVAVFQYDGTQWNDGRVLPHFGLDALARFGNGVAVKRNHILSSAPVDTISSVSGAGCVFLHSLPQTWHLYGQQISEFLGKQVDINQTRMLTSTPNEKAGSMSYAGAAYLYRRHGRQWVLEQKFTEPVQAELNLFGYSSALGRNALIISAIGNDTPDAEAGRVYVYERNGITWSLAGQFSGTLNSRLGKAVAICEPYIAYTEYIPATAETKIVTRRRNPEGSWNRLPDIIQPSGGGFSGDISFGCSIAIEGNRIIVGAKTYNSNAGTAFLYEWDGTQWQLRDTQLTTAPNSSFGTAIAIHGNKVAIGAPKFNSHVGAVPVYDITTNHFDLITILARPTEQADADYFGNSVAFANDGRTILIGAYRKEVSEEAAVGCIYVYRENPMTGSWVNDATIFPTFSGGTSPQDYTYFGKVIAAYNNTVVAGAYGTSINLASAGEVSVFELSPCLASADFDGDGITDIGCYYAPGGNWYVFKSGSATLWVNNFGYANTTPFVNDFDGDWKTDFGCFDPASGNWFGFNSTDGFWTRSFGNPGTQRITGDFDGDGLSDIGFFDSSIPRFFFMGSAVGYSFETFGTIGGTPITGDFDGDGLDDYGTFYAPTGEWKINRSRDGAWTTHFGYSGTVPITGDFDGDGTMDFGCYYAPSGAWYIYKSRDGFWENNFGYAGTLPVTGDFDGDGIDDFGCYYPPPGAWYVYKSTEGFWVNNFGYTGTVPMN